MRFGWTGLFRPKYLVGRFACLFSTSLSAAQFEVKRITVGTVEMTLLAPLRHADPVLPMGGPEVSGAPSGRRD
jgi:hypothetical protein